LTQLIDLLRPNHAKPKPKPSPNFVSHTRWPDDAAPNSEPKTTSKGSWTKRQQKAAAKEEQGYLSLIALAYVAAFLSFRVA